MCLTCVRGSSCKECAGRTGFREVALHPWFSATQALTCFLDQDSAYSPVSNRIAVRPASMNSKPVIRETCILAVWLP